jgi:hemoglobin
MKEDIQTRADIHKLISTFYKKVLDDQQIGFIFTDIAKINLDTHLEHLTNFWENTLLTSNNYNTNVLQVHLNLNNKINLTTNHFKQWLKLFHATVNELFVGLTANSAKNRADSIATVIQIKLNVQEK